MVLKLVFRLEPIAFTLAMMTIEMPAAINPYSIAVAPDSSFRNAKTLDMLHTPGGPITRHDSGMPLTRVSRSHQGTAQRLVQMVTKSRGRFAFPPGHRAARSGKKPPSPAASLKSSHVWTAYFNCVEMLLNLPLRLEPIALTVAMITTEMPAAIRPYSIAVAPDSSFRNAYSLDI